MARNGRSMRADECLFSVEKRSCSRSSGAFIMSSPNGTCVGRFGDDHIGVRCGPTDRIAYATGRGVAAGLDESRCSRGKRDVEGEEMIGAGLDALRGSVHLQLDLR